MADSLFPHDELEVYKIDANEALTLKLVRGEADEVVFKPEMTHQVFGEAESIFGYKGLEVCVCMSACQLHTCVQVKYVEKISSKKSGGVKADDIEALLADKLLGGYSTDLNTFQNRIGPSDFTQPPFGTLCNSYSLIQPDTGAETRFEVYHVEACSSEFKKWHERMQVLLLFFIDAASYIQLDDSRWHFYVLYERFKGEGGGGLAFIGYMSVYNYYAYPDLIRPRISQMLVLPPWQGKGHGSRLLQTFYNWTKSNPTVLDVAVEEPSDNFQRMRDLVDCSNAAKLLSLSGELNESFLAEMKGKLKLSKKQAQRVYEMLQLREVRKVNKHTDIQADNGPNTQADMHTDNQADKHTDNQADKHTDKAGGSFQLFKRRVKIRLNIPLQKNSRHFERLSTRLQANELSAAMNHHSTQQRLQLLERQFAELLRQYEHVIAKLPSD